MVERELDLIVSRHAPGVCGLYWCGEVDRANPMGDLPKESLAGAAELVHFLKRDPHRAILPVMRLLEFLKSEETEQTPWVRLDRDCPASIAVPRIALCAGVVRLATATFCDGSTATYARRVNLN